MTILQDHYRGDSVLFKVSAYDEDGITAVTPSSATCSVWAADDSAIVTDAAGTVGSGYAKYSWATSTSAAGQYRAILKVTFSGGAVKSEEFWVTLREKPPTFTTDPETEIGEVRLELGDDNEGDGVRPDGANLTDAQIQVLIDREGSVMRAVAAACELLARQWTRVANITVGPRSEQFGQVSEQWAKRAATLRSQYGGGGSGGFSIAATRTDGFSEAADDASEYTTA